MSNEKKQEYVERLLGGITENKDLYDTYPFYYLKGCDGEMTLNEAVEIIYLARERGKRYEI